MLTIEQLASNFPRTGSIVWIGLRPDRRAPMASVESAKLLESGLVGDHRNKAGARAVTLIQFEHLASIAALIGAEQVDPSILRRNLVVSGINVAALRHRKFRVGSALLKGIEPCAPCSRMEEALGDGGYNAMRGHGGLCATVLEPGRVSVGDPVRAENGPPST